MEEENFYQLTRKEGGVRIFKGKSEVFLIPYTNHPMASEILGCKCAWEPGELQRSVDW